MKKLILLVAMLFCLSGCGTTYGEVKNNDSLEQESHYGSGYFTLIKEWGGVSNTNSIVYAKDTKVKYYIYHSGYRFGITPLYNADGTIQVYEGE